MLRVIVSYSLLGVLVLATLGQLVRDRSLFLMLWMFVPVVLVALAAIFWDVLLRGRALWIRWLLCVVAVGCAGLAASWQWRPALAPEVGAGHSLRVVHWNTMWGGGSSEAFARIIDRLDAEQPDIACLSEAPERAELDYAWKQKHAGWSMAEATNHGHGSYWFNLIVVSRYPVQLRDVRTLERGRLALFEVAHPARTLRIVMVDLLSSPVSPRSPSIRQAAELFEAHVKAGEPIDLVLGDFNTPGRFLGFDALERAAGGFRRAALWSGEWRGTWLSVLPIFDIDHIWVNTRLRIRGAAFFATLASDHRGQRADLTLP